jgi:hypothetical protein
MVFSQNLERFSQNWSVFPECSEIVVKIKNSGSMICDHAFFVISLFSLRCERAFPCIAKSWWNGVDKRVLT